MNIIKLLKYNNCSKWQTILYHFSEKWYYSMLLFINSSTNFRISLSILSTGNQKSFCSLSIAEIFVNFFSFLIIFSTCNPKKWVSSSILLEFTSINLVLFYNCERPLWKYSSFGFHWISCKINHYTRVNKKYEDFCHIYVT